MYDPWSDRIEHPPRGHITRDAIKAQEKASINKILDSNSYDIKKKPKPISEQRQYDPFGAGHDYNDQSDHEGSNRYSSRGTMDLPKKRSEKEIRDAETRVKRLERIEATKSANLPEGTILKVYEGSLEHIKDNQNIKVALYTCDSNKTVTKIPELAGNDEDGLKILKKIPKENVEAYLEKTLNSKDEKNLHIMSGWIECSISLYQSRYEQIARDFLKNKEVGTATYGNDTARIIFLHKDQLSLDYKVKLNFRTRRTSKTSNPILYFIILSKPEKYTSNTRFIAPTVEKSWEDIKPKDFSAGKKSLEEFEQDYDKVSEGTSIEDFEPDFGAAVDDKDSLASLEDEDQEKIEPKKKVTIIDPKSLNTPPFARKRKEVEIEDISDVKTKDHDRRERKFNHQSYNERLNNHNQKDKYNQYNKRSYESDRDGSEDIGYTTITKKLKPELEDDKDQQLINRLKTMDQDEIMEYAKSIPAHKRQALMNLLKNMEAHEKPRSKNEYSEQSAHNTSMESNRHLHTPESKPIPWYKQILNTQSPISSYPTLETQNLPFIQSAPTAQTILPTQSPIRVSPFGLNRFGTSPFGKSLDMSAGAYRTNTETVIQNMQSEDLTLNNPPSIHHTPIKASQGLQGHKNNQIKRDNSPITYNNNFQNNRFQQDNQNNFNQQTRSPFNKKSFQQNQNQQYRGNNRNLNQTTPDLLQTIATNFNLSSMNFDQVGGLKNTITQKKEFNSMLQNDDQTIDSYFGSNTIISQQKRTSSNFNNQRNQPQSGLNFLNTPLLSFNNHGN